MGAVTVGLGPVKPARSVLFTWAGPMPQLNVFPISNCSKIVKYKTCTSFSPKNFKLCKVKYNFKRNNFMD
jgi:hypothetical protein